MKLPKFDINIKEKIPKIDLSSKNILTIIKNIAIFLIKLMISIFGTTIGIFFTLFQSLCGILSLGILCACLCGCFVYVKIKPDLDSCREIAYDKLANASDNDFISGMDTYIYDKDKNIIGFINAGNFDYVNIGEISMNIQNAYISQEDKRFKEHTGVDWISTIRAGLALIKNDGEITQGGSTITQQLIKNTYLTQEKTFKRKMIEIMLAPQIEQKYSKPKIMEYYCNTNYYGNRCYGVQAASYYYFGKDAADVTLAEAATLVGISNSPSAYDPVTNPEASIKKRNEVIENMYKNGFITEEEKEDAVNESFIVMQNGSEETFETYQSTYALHCAAIKLMEESNFKFKYIFKNKEDYDEYMLKYDSLYAEKVEELRTGGYRIYTSFDSNIQEILQNNIDSSLSKFTEEQENGKFALQGAAAVADNETGYIVAIVGGRGTEDQFNRAYLSARQPGSAIKPLIDYAPAFDTGNYYPSKIMVDKPIEDGPKNSGGSYRGSVTLREAANRSINTIAWTLLQEIGIDYGLSYLGEMQFQKITHIDNNVAALSIGGFTNGLRVVDMTKGYQTLANDGLYNTNTCIVEIKNNENETILLNRIKRKQVYEEDTAYLMTDVLKGTLYSEIGTGYGLGLKDDRPAAGKTGTTNSNKDTWFCGYTKQYTTAVWVGYDTPRAMPGVYGSTYAGRIWRNVMNEIHENLEMVDWTAPETVYESNYDPSTGKTTSSDTGVKDLFSKMGEIRAEKINQEKEAKEALELAIKKVEAYENSTISGPEDVYRLEDEFFTINELLSKVEDSIKRKELYNRAYYKYKAFLVIKEEMADEILLYEKQKEKEKKEALQAAEAKAKADRERFVKETRQKEVDNYIKEMNSYDYKPDNSESLINNATEALANLLGYDTYLSYSRRLQSAIDRINSLPTYKEYTEQERLKQQAIINQGPGLNSTNQNNNLNYGPGYSPSTYKPGN